MIGAAMNGNRACFDDGGDGLRWAFMCIHQTRVVTQFYTASLSRSMADVIETGFLLNRCPCFSGAAMAQQRT